MVQKSNLVLGARIGIFVGDASQFSFQNQLWQGMQ
jgi:hypothetical protein